MGFAQNERLGTGQHAHMFKNVYPHPPLRKSGVETPPQKNVLKKVDTKRTDFSKNH